MNSQLFDDNKQKDEDLLSTKRFRQYYLKSFPFRALMTKFSI